MLFWNKGPGDTQLQVLIELLEKGNKYEIDRLLLQPTTTPVDYLPVTYDMLLKFKRPATSPEKLSIYKTHTKKNFTLIIFNLPWVNEAFQFSPLIINNKTNKVVGIMLPFNEIRPLLSNQEVKVISALGMLWTKFVIERRFV